MPRRVRISEPALRWLEQEAERIAARFGAVAAADFSKRIDLAVENLAAFPEMAKRGRIPGSRTITVFGRTVMTIVERDGDLVIAAARSHWQQDAHAPPEAAPPGDGEPEDS